MKVFAFFLDFAGNNAYIIGNDFRKARARMLFGTSIVMHVSRDDGEGREDSVSLHQRTCFRRIGRVQSIDSECAAGSDNFFKSRNIPLQKLLNANYFRSSHFKKRHYQVKMERTLCVNRDEFDARPHALLSPYSGFDECVEQRVWREGAGFEFWVELGAEHKGVRALGQLRDFHEPAIGRFPREYKSRILQAFDVLGIHLEAMAVTLGNTFFAIRLACDCVRHEFARIGAETHRAAVILLGEVFYLLRQDGNDGMRAFFVYLSRVGALQICDIAGVFDGHELHAVAKPEVRDFVLPYEADGVYFALDTRLAESAGDDDPVIFLELGDGRGITL